jgi:type IV secretory pathway VirB2 component (pilin)
MKLRNKIYTFAILLLSTPVFVLAQEKGIVKCGNTAGQQCTWNDLMKLVSDVMTEGFKYALLFSVFIIILAGFNIMRAQGDIGKMKEARKMLMNVVIGAIIILGSYMIVNALIKALGGFESKFDILDNIIEK